MKDDLKRFIVRHAILEKLMFFYYHTKNFKTTLKESQERKELSLFNYPALCAEIPYGPEERVIDNNLYGYAHHLKKYAGIKKDLKGYLEHGLFWGGMIHKDEYNWHFNRIITLCKFRCKSIEEQLPNKKAIAVGPYIHYADHVFSPEKLSALKKTLGRVLLVYPSHSVKNLEAQFNFEQFIKKINALKKDFDTVLISLYFIDAQNPEMVKLYENHGFKVVTSGHKFDLNFVARQKTIITLADMTMSNEVGTHVGYCNYLNKPHYIFKQSIKRVATSAAEQKRFDTVATKSNYQTEAEQKNAFFEAFSTYDDKNITDKQRQLCAEYWGYDDVKSAEELREIFN